MLVTSWNVLVSGMVLSESSALRVEMSVPDAGRMKCLTRTKGKLGIPLTQRHMFTVNDVAAVKREEPGRWTMAHTVGMTGTRRIRQLERKVKDHDDMDVDALMKTMASSAPTGCSFSHSHSCQGEYHIRGRNCHNRADAWSKFGQGQGQHQVQITFRTEHELRVMRTMQKNMKLETEANTMVMSALCG